jgi:hypothetical protein
VRWGREHLYYEACRVAWRKRRAGTLIGFVWSGLGAIVTGVFGGPYLGLAIGAVAAGSVWAIRRSPYLPLPEEAFDKLWHRWRTAHPGTRGLIERPPEIKAPRVSEADMAHYSFDRAVICDRARTVDLLLANNFHFENNCAVLGANGYPKATFELVRRMLRRNPRLQVFVVHDATEEGCKLARRLASDPDWFFRIGRVIDVGVRPHHAAAFRGAFRKADRPVVNQAGLLPGEAEWLSKHTFELAAIRPEQVIKRLFRAMTANPAPEARPGEPLDLRFGSHHHHEQPDQGVDAGESWADGATAGDSWGVDMDSFGSDASDGDGGADSFG